MEKFFIARWASAKCRLRDTNPSKKKLRNETNYEYNNLFSIFSERGKGEKKNDENSAASLKNHVNENIFILFMLEYQIKFSAAFFFAFSGL